MCGGERVDVRGRVRERVCVRERVRERVSERGRVRERERELHEERVLCKCIPWLGGMKSLSSRIRL